MELKVVLRDPFSVCGYCVETCLENCGSDLAALWQTYEAGKQALYDTYGCRDDYYGLMWYTEKHRYRYLIGIEAREGEAPEGTCLMLVPGAAYAVAGLPGAMPAVAAWTEFYEKTIPEAGYLPDAAHGFNFEYYPGGSGDPYELWTPVIPGRKV